MSIQGSKLNFNPRTYLPTDGKKVVSIKMEASHKLQIPNDHISGPLYSSNQQCDGNSIDTREKF